MIMQRKTQQMTLVAGLCLAMGGAFSAAQMSNPDDDATRPADRNQYDADKQKQMDKKHKDHMTTGQPQDWQHDTHRSQQQMLQAESLIGQAVYTRQGAAATTADKQAERTATASPSAADPYGTATPGTPTTTVGTADAGDKQIGTLYDIVIDTQSKEVVYAALDTDTGITDFTSQTHAVPWSAFSFESNARPIDETWSWGAESRPRIYTTLTSQQLEQAEGFDTDNWPVKANTSLGGHAGSAAYRSDATTQNRNSGINANQRADDAAAANSATTSAQGQGLAGNSRLVRVSELVGREVNNAQDEQVGTISDIVISSRGRVAFAVVNADEWLDGDKSMAAVPIGALTHRGEDQPLRLNATKQQLQKQAFAEGNRPNFSDPQWSRGVHQDFDQENDYTVLGYSAVYVIPDSNNNNAWGGQSDYNKYYDASKAETISGKVEHVKTIRLDNQSGEGVCLTIKDDQDNAKELHLGPRDYVDKQINIDKLKDADQVTAKGAMATVNGKQVLLVRELNVDGRSITLRDQSGQPLWDSQSDSGMNNDRDDMGQDRDRSDSNSGSPGSNLTEPGEQQRQRDYPQQQ